ncbi:MAG: hypothetical protein DLM61_19700 [Pseudonocardiales bacterium]|nr:MAG: hypothetical protein DLM61_19700 [Pseudonocardiales bacterium]
MIVLLSEGARIEGAVAASGFPINQVTGLRSALRSGLPELPGVQPLGRIPRLDDRASPALG